MGPWETREEVREVPRRRPVGTRLGRPIWIAAVAVTVLLLSVSGRYGFHRDELYFVVAGRRLDWGFVDQPPLTPLLARISETIGGASPTAIRVLPALAIGAVVVLAAAMARRFGGGAKAQLFAGIAAGGAGYALAVGHLLSTSTFDYLLWTLAIWLFVGLLDGDDPRRWLLLGGVVGVGLQNKHLIGLLAVAMLLALALSPQRRTLATRWPWFGAALAALIALPNLVWQATNEFPQLEMARALAGRSDGAAAFVLEQIGLLSIVLIVPFAIGWWRLIRLSEMATWRAIGIVTALLFAFFLVTGGKSYYLAPLYPVCLAAGALWFEELGDRGRRAMTGFAAAGIFAGLFIALPLVPPTSVASIDATGELGETVGWPELVDQIAVIYASIPEGPRQETVIFTGSYGEAGAVDVLGADAGLPAASSGHNSYWHWGPPEPHGPIIGVGGVGGALAIICPDLEEVGVIANPYGVENEEAGLPLFLCREPARQLSDIWPEMRHYD